MLSTFGLFGAVFACQLFTEIRLNRGCWFHFIKSKIIHHVYKLFLTSAVFLFVFFNQDSHIDTPNKKMLQLSCFTYFYLTRHTAESQHFFSQCGLFEQQNMIECALGQEWVALFQPKWGYLYNMSSDEAGTAACGIPYPELPFQGRNYTLVPFTLFPEPPKFTFQQHFPDSKSRPDLYQAVNNF